MFEKQKLNISARKKREKKKEREKKKKKENHQSNVHFKVAVECS